MPKRYLYTTLLLILYTLVHSPLAAQDSLASDSITEEPIEETVREVVEATPDDSETLIYKVELHDMIGPPTARLLEQSMDAAEKMGADIFLIDLDTYGGYVASADEMVNRLLNTEMTTVIFVRDHAASAGAYISIACDSIYMHPIATIGAAAVVNQNGEYAPEKYQSYMRGQIRRAAEQTGRDPEIAEGMVDERIEIEGITEAGEIITFTTKEAIAVGYCQGEAKDIDEVIQLLNVPNYEMTEHSLSGVDKVINFFVNPAVSGILLMIIIAGIYFELQTPGVGFPLAAAAVAAILYFLPLYLEGLAENWEILIFIIGIVLIAVELFVIPGFGVAGISGIVLTVGGLTLSLLGNDGINFNWVPIAEFGKALLLVVGAGSLATGAFVLLGGSVLNSKRFKYVTLATSQNKADGYIIDIKSNQQIIGMEGLAVTDLRPSGKIEINDERYDAQADAEYILKGSTVKVIKAQGAYLTVEKVADPEKKEEIF